MHLKRHCLLPLALIGVATVAARAQDARMVPVEGHQMRVRVGGLDHQRTGQPVVVLESGLAGRLENWDRVFTKIASVATVVAYDRAGVGQSESDGQPPTPRHVARTLRALLRQVGVNPPYVLVGHSWGGPLIRMFVAAYPEDVAGLVYVDVTDMRSQEEDLAYYQARGHAAADVPELRQQRRQRLRAFHPEMSVALALEDTYFAEFRTLPAPPDVPVSVLMATKFDPAPWAGEPCQPRDCHDAWVRLRMGWQTSHARQSSDGTFTLTTKSGHDILRDDPDLVAWAIQRVLTSAKARR